MILIILKSALAMAVFLLLYRLFLEKESLYRFNRFFLLGSLVISLALPFVVLPSIFPRIQETPKVVWEQLLPVEVPMEDEVFKSGLLTEKQAAEKIPSEIQPNKKFDLYLVVGMVYFLGFSIFFFRFIIQLIQFRKLKSANPLLQKGGFKVVLLPEKNLPFTFLDYLFVSEVDYKANKIEPEIWEHELAHIRQKHSWDILFVEVLKVLLWFNPLLLLYKKAIQINHEYLADEAVNRQFQNKTAYQMLLFSKVSQSQLNLSLSSPFNFSVTKKRLIMMGTFTSPGKSMMLKGFTFTIVLAVFFSLAPSSFTTANPISLSPLKSSADEYEKIINNAFDKNQPYILDNSKLDLPKLKQAYDRLNEDEKENVTEFPFFEPEAYSRLIHLQQMNDKVKVTFLYNIPPEKKQIKPEVWEVWKESKKVQLEIDEVPMNTSVLDEYAIEDFALFEVREIEKGGFLKKPAFSVKLTTHDQYHQKFIQRKKEIRIISAVFENGDKAQVYYSSKFTFAINYMDDPSFEPIIPKHFEATVLDAFINFEPEKYRVSNIILKEDLEKEIQISIWIDNKGKSVFVPIIENGNNNSQNHDL